MLIILIMTVLITIIIQVVVLIRTTITIMSNMNVWVLTLFQQRTVQHSTTPQ